MNEILSNLNNKNNNHTQFDTGAVRDSQEGKEDYIESISWLTLARYAFYMKGQEKKYGRGNWRKGIPQSSYEASLMRHLQKYIANKYYGANLEPDVDHLAAALFNLQGLMHEQEMEKLNKPITTDINGENPYPAFDIFETARMVLEETISPRSKKRRIALETQDILELRSKGCTNEEVSAALGLSERTVYRRLKQQSNK